MKHTWKGRELEWINDHGLKIDGNGIIQIPRAKWARMQYTDKSLRHPGKHTLMIPSDFGCCLLTEGMHFEIIGGNKEMAKYKCAESKGAYIDRLRTKYPFRIYREAEPQYSGVLVGVQPLLDGQEMPIYRFSGGDSCEDPFGNGIKILEW